MILREFMGLIPVEQSKLYLKDGLLDSPDPTLLFGLELEIENATNLEMPRLFSWTEDGSLRNRGREFITRPANYTTTVRGLQKFFALNPTLQTIKESDGDYSPLSNYSDRTSIHVHTNCQDMTMKQLASLCMLYQVFERLLYAYVGGDRQQNIFCVPWHETLISNRTIKTLLEGHSFKIHEWQKYTGLNLKPLERFGTVEWRHMHGHNNLEHIVGWLRIISCIFRAAKTMEFEELLSQFLQLNTTSQYERMFHTVFRYVPEFRIPGYQSLLEEGVLDLKYDWVHE